MQSKYQKEIELFRKKLTVLRTLANVTQDELARFVGVSRQTYTAIETGKRQMSWRTFLGLLFYFDFNCETHTMLRTLELFPERLVSEINGKGESG